MIRKVDGPATVLVLRTGVVMAAVLAPLQLVIGDLHGLSTLEHQPAKIAAVEAVWETDTAVPFTVLGWPDEEARTTRFALEIPYGTSLLLEHHPQGRVRGLNEFEGAHPPVAIVFFAFRAMVGMGLLMIAVSWWALWSQRGGRPLPRRVLRALALMTFGGWIAVLAGWYVTEVGRQPWLVYGLLPVAEAAAPHPAGKVAATLTAYALLYAVLLAAYIGTLRYMGTKPAKSLRLLELHEQPPAGAQAER